MTHTVKSADLGAIELNASDYVTATLQDVAAVLTTRQGSIPLNRRFGLPMRFMDMPINIGITVMIAEVTEAIGEFVPNVELLEVTAEVDSNEPGRIYPTVEVRILDEQES